MAADASRDHVLEVPKEYSYTLEFLVCAVAARFGLTPRDVDVIADRDPGEFARMMAYDRVCRVEEARRGSN